VRAACAPLSAFCSRLAGSQLSLDVCSVRIGLSTDSDPQVQQTIRQLYMTENQRTHKLYSIANSEVCVYRETMHKRLICIVDFQMRLSQAQIYIWQQSNEF